MIANRELQETTDQAAGEAEMLQHNQEHYKQILELKDKQVALLEGHIAQFTQSISHLSLSPQEKAKAKRGGSSGSEAR